MFVSETARIGYLTKARYHMTLGIRNSTPRTFFASCLRYLLSLLVQYCLFRLLVSFLAIVFFLFFPVPKDKILEGMVKRWY